jgi:hypothetical protein
MATNKLPRVASDDIDEINDIIESTMIADQGYNQENYRLSFTKGKPKEWSKLCREWMATHRAALKRMKTVYDEVHLLAIEEEITPK